jgi:hypothetical protein
MQKSVNQATCLLHFLHNYTLAVIAPAAKRESEAKLICPMKGFSFTAQLSATEASCTLLNDK